MNTQLFFVAAMSSVLALGCSDSAKEDSADGDEVIGMDVDADGADADEGAEDGDDDGTTGGSTGGGTTSGSTDGGSSTGDGSTDGGTSSGDTDGVGAADDGSTTPPGSDDGGATDGIGGLGDEGPPIEEGGSSVGGDETDDDGGDDGETDGGATDDGETGDGETGDGETGDGETDGGETDDGATDDGETDDGETDGGETDGGDDEAGGEAGGETGEVPETDTDIDDVDTDLGDSTSAGMDLSDCDLYVEFDEDADGEIDRVEHTFWDADENVVSEMTGYPTVEGGEAALLAGYQENAYDGDCQTLDAYYIGYIRESDPSTLSWSYQEEYVYSCDEKGEFAGYEYTKYDNYTDDALEDGEADEYSSSAVATNTYNDRDQIISQTVEYSDEVSGLFLTRELTQAFDGDELDSYEVAYVVTDPMLEGLFGEDMTYEVDSRNDANLPTAATWYTADRGDVRQNGEWTYDDAGNTLTARIWLDGEYDFNDSYSYDEAGNQVYYRYFEAVGGQEYVETWAFDAEGNEIEYTLDNPDFEQVYSLASTYDDTVDARVTGKIWDLDSDEVDDFEQVVLYSADSFPWAYDSELSQIATGEVAEAEKGEYNCE